MLQIITNHYHLSSIQEPKVKEHRYHHYHHNHHHRLKATHARNGNDSVSQISTPTRWSCSPDDNELPDVQEHQHIPRVYSISPSNPSSKVQYQYLDPILNLHGVGEICFDKVM
jgi:hypothetical protein